jgi:hypothetical protein
LKQPVGPQAGGLLLSARGRARSKDFVMSNAQDHLGDIEGKLDVLRVE